VLSEEEIVPGSRRVTDVVIVVPGITGTELVDRDGATLWGLKAAPILRGLVTLGRSLDAVRLRDPEADDGVRPGRVIRGLHVLPGGVEPEDRVRVAARRVAAALHPATR
jgi:hypothetical protein